MADDEGKKETEYQLQRQHTYKIVTSFMSESFEQDAINISIVALDKYKTLKEVAFYIKQQYDRKYPGSGKAAEGVYHCAVGKSFASASLFQTCMHACGPMHSTSQCIQLALRDPIHRVFPHSWKAGVARTSGTALSKLMQL